MESVKLSIKEGTHRAAYISISIIHFTSKGVKKITYRSIIGPFHRVPGKRWRRKKRLAARIRNSNKSWSSSQWRVHKILRENVSSTQLQSSLQPMIKWVISISICITKIINYARLATCTRWQCCISKLPCCYEAKSDQIGPANHLWREGVSSQSVCQAHAEAEGRHSRKSIASS